MCVSSIRPRRPIPSIGSTASAVWPRLLRLRVDVEFADQARSVPGSPFSKVSDERFNQFAVGFVELLRTTEIGGIALN
jgi:hypothetical protein